MILVIRCYYIELCFEFDHLLSIEFDGSSDALQNDATTIMNTRITRRAETVVLGPSEKLQVEARGNCRQSSRCS